MCVCVCVSFSHTNELQLLNYGFYANNLENDNDEQRFGSNDCAQYLSLYHPYIFNFAGFPFDVFFFAFALLVFLLLWSKQIFEYFNFDAMLLPCKAKTKIRIHYEEEGENIRPFCNALHRQNISTIDISNAGVCK